jgi:hypothetical protein
MKNLYLKIKFVYSLPYNRMLTEYEKKEFDEKQNFEEIKEYIKKLQPKWNKISDSVCRTLKEMVKNEWREKEIKCYVVKYCKFSAISTPLTLRVEKDFDYVFDILIHELAHILVGYDFEKYRKIEQKLKERFLNENPFIIRHIYINWIELQVLKRLFNQKSLDKILKKVLSVRGNKAWNIVLTKENNLKSLFKISA